jgi:hypothetical protein
MRDVINGGNVAKCNKEFVMLLDLDGNEVDVRRSAVVAMGESDSPKYKSWVLLSGLPAGDDKLFLNMPLSDVRSLIG